MTAKFIVDPDVFAFAQANNISNDTLYRYELLKFTNKVKSFCNDDCYVNWEEIDKLFKQMYKVDSEV